MDEFLSQRALGMVQRNMDLLSEWATGVNSHHLCSQVAVEPHTVLCLYGAFTAQICLLRFCTHDRNNLIKEFGSVSQDWSHGFQGFPLNGELREGNEWAQMCALTFEGIFKLATALGNKLEYLHD